MKRTENAIQIYAKKMFKFSRAAYPEKSRKYPKWNKIFFSNLKPPNLGFAICNITRTLKWTKWLTMKIWKGDEMSFLGQSDKKVDSTRLFDSHLKKKSIPEMFQKLRADFSILPGKIDCVSYKACMKIEVRLWSLYKGKHYLMILKVKFTSLIINCLLKLVCLVGYTSSSRVELRPISRSNRGHKAKIGKTLRADPENEKSRVEFPPKEERVSLRPFLIHNPRRWKKKKVSQSFFSLSPLFSRQLRQEKRES